MHGGAQLGDRKPLGAGRTLDAGPASEPGEPGPVTQRYEADLLGNIQQALAGLQGFDIMALELIQNADDAGATTMRFDVRPDGLHVWNSERFSSCGLLETTCPHLTSGGADGSARPCNFHAISRMGSRSKINVGSQIGRFGIGFVSVYQVTDRPVIRSRDIQMALDPLNSTSPTQRIAEIDGTEFELPWASAATATRKALNASPAPADVREKIEAEIRGVMDRGLFFLRRLERVELLIDGVLSHAVSIERDGGVLTLLKSPEEKRESWLVLAADASARADELELKIRFPMLGDLDRSTRVSVAIPLGAGPFGGLLYAYLPTEQASRLPLHINADFFPHPNRRSIVLTGEQHDRYWNELLLETAASAIADNFQTMANTIGASRLWEIGTSALSMRADGAFGVFWTKFAEAARGLDCSWSVAERWCALATSYLPPDTMPPEHQMALAGVGIDILHADMRSNWTALNMLGAKQLRLSPIIDALAEIYGGAVPSIDPPTNELLAAVDAMVAAALGQPGAEAALARLRAIPFLAATGGTLHAPSRLRTPPPGSSADRVAAFVPDVAFAHVGLSEHPSLAALVPTYAFDELAVDLARRISSEEEARQAIGTSPDRVRAFYDLLVAAAGAAPEGVSRELLATTPILRTRSGFTSPSRGLLPGGFDDPVGHLTVVDVAAMTPAMLELAKLQLGVETLSFADYVRKHLSGILAAEPSQAQYRSLMREIATHWRELAAANALTALAQTPFLRTRAGGYARPADVYFFTAQLEASLGAGDERWVDENWLPHDGSQSRLRDLLESELGLPRHATIGHLVDRIEEIAQGEPDDAAAKPLNLIARHLVERLPSMDDEERTALERLRDLEWLPASLDGERQEYWYAPHEVYRPFRSAGFASQAPVVDLPAFRSTQLRGLTDFLDFIEMMEEPPTYTVVAHLRHCMANDRQPSDYVYQMLSEGVERNAASLEPLRGTSFIYVAAEARWLSADEVFWEAPPFRRHWHAASPNMHQRAPLYRQLGVVNRPEPVHYARLLQRLGEDGQLDEDGRSVHGRCLAVLAEALETGALTPEILREELGDAPILVNLDEQGTFAEDAIWSDAEWLAAPFAGSLDAHLVATPACSRGTAAKLFRALDVDRLTSVARLRLAADPEGRRSADATDLLAERADLLLWLAPTAGARKRLLDALLELEVSLTVTLQVQAELLTSDPPTRSAASSVAAFYEAEQNVLHMREEAGSPLDWSAAFRDLFAQLDLVPHDVDVRPVIMAAVYVMGATSPAAAEQALRTAEYSPPWSSEGRDGERGEAFEDLEEETDSDDIDEDTDGFGTDDGGDDIEGEGAADDEDGDDDADQPNGEHDAEDTDHVDEENSAEEDDDDEGRDNNAGGGDRHGDGAGGDKRQGGATNEGGGGGPGAGEAERARRAAVAPVAARANTGRRDGAASSPTSSPPRTRRTMPVTGTVTTARTISARVRRRRRSISPRSTRC